MKANKPLLIQLNVVYQYLVKLRKVSGNLDVIKSLSDDITAQDIAKWALPNYKDIMTVLSIEDGTDHQKALFRLTACMQLLLSSYCCYQSQDPAKFMFDCLLVKFIRMDILPNKTKNSKIIQRFHSGKGLSIKKSKMLKVHCKLLASIINLKLKIVTLPTEKSHSDDMVQFFQMIRDFCMYMECLIHAFIAQLSVKDSMARQKGSAFNQHYLARTKSLPDKHVKDILLIVSENDLQPESRAKSLKIVIKALLGVLDSISWSLLDENVKQKKAHIVTMARLRMNIQSTLLIAGDTDLTSKFRLISWPNWTTDP